jgi:CheY-like chemotaxis protein
VAGVAANGREAVQAAVTLRPDVLVMDVQMPELTGVAAAGEISRVAPDVAVLMLTMFDDDYSVLAAMRAGTCSREPSRTRSSGRSRPWPRAKPSSGQASRAWCLAWARHRQPPRFRSRT